MKLLKTGFFALALGLATVASEKSFAAEDKIWTVGTDQGYVSQYLWRGTNQHNDGYQGDVYLGLWDSLTFNVWWDVPTKTTSGLDTGQAYEIDYTVDYAFSYEDFSFNVGHIVYDFPQTPAGQDSNTSEVYLVVAYDTMLSPTLGIYYDYDLVDGVYLQFDVSHGIDVSDWAALGLGASVGYAIDEGPSNKANAWSYYDKNSGFTSLELSAGMDFALGHFSPMLENATLSTGFNYSVRGTDMIAGKSANAPAFGKDDFVVSINLNIEF